MNVHARCMLMLGKCYAKHKRCYINSAIFGIIGGLTTQAPQAVAWAGSPAAMEGKARAQCTEASSTWHEHRRGDHTVFSPRLSSVPGSATVWDASVKP
jgi:hypothetical protein